MKRLLSYQLRDARSLSNGSGFGNLGLDRLASSLGLELECMLIATGHPRPISLNVNWAIAPSQPADPGLLIPRPSGLQNRLRSQLNPIDDRPGDPAFPSGY